MSRTVNLDVISDHEVSGWAWDSSDPFGFVDVEIRDNSKTVITVSANLYRADLKDAGLGNGFHAFCVTFPLTRGSQHDLSQVEARIADSGPEKNRSMPSLPGRLLSRIKCFIKKGAPGISIDKSDAYPLQGLPVEGRIESVSDNVIDTWVHASDNICEPLVMVGNQPARLQEVLAESSSGNYGPFPPTITGYRFCVSGMSEGDDISLYGVCNDKPEKLHSLSAPSAYLERSVLAQLTRAAETAKQTSAVAITCWDGAHNPIGRAKVLYDTIGTRRPVAMFCFIFEEFGDGIWPPLANTDDNIVMIPWSNRFLYFRIVRAMGIEFETVWMCKPRAPTFHMSALIAAPDARLILDIDDNEEQFSRDTSSRNKPYGLASIGVSRLLTDAITARTAPGISLAKEYNATIVRHARQRADSVTPCKAVRSGPCIIGFIGTVRRHKGMLEAARAINKLASESSTQFQLHVYGDVRPASLCDELTAEGAVVKQNIRMSELNEHLSGMDIILTGYPSSTESDDQIQKYQISSKIGDALAVGRPALVPSSDSVTDLADVDGVYIFDEDTFAQQLLAAAQSTDPVDMPASFSLNGAYAGFSTAEALANDSPRASHALSLLPQYDSIRNSRQVEKPSLLLIWKQHDAALYGRRIDQIARAYQRAHADHKVVILEIVHRDFDHLFQESSSELSEFHYLRELALRKRNGDFVSGEGCEYRQIAIDSQDELCGKFFEFLAHNELLPTNTVITLFPYLDYLDLLTDILKPFQLVTDVVDNNYIAKEGRMRQQIVRQCHYLLNISDHVIFNSERNFQELSSSGILGEGANNVSVIENWYMLPSDFSRESQKHSTGVSADTFNIAYTGNMNDRINWPLMEEIARLDDGIRLHLAGNASGAGEELEKLLALPNVCFHGPLQEEMTLALLAQSDLAVMPHTIDNVSTFMNPLKVLMYQAMGLHTISTNVPGIRAHQGLTIATDSDDFLQNLRGRLEFSTCSQRQFDNGQMEEKISNSAKSYIELIDNLRNHNSV